MGNDEGFDSVRCTHPRCRRHLDPGAGIQMLMTLPDGSTEEHRHCVQHHAEYMNREVADERG